MSWTAPSTRATGDLITASIYNTDLINNLLALGSVGSYKYKAESSAGSGVLSIVDGGWFETNGAAPSRTTYAALFAKIGTTFGNGDGSTTFTLPDFTGRLPLHVSPTGPALINSLGKNEGVALAQRNVSHKHNAQIAVYGSSGNGAGPNNGTGSQTNTVSMPTDGDSNNVDYPAFLVGGIWLIKF